MPLFRVLRAFLEGFPCWMWVCVVCVPCVACVALYACGVRRIRGLRRVCLSFCPFAFLLLLLCLPPFMLVILLCSGCLSLFSCIVFVVFWVLVVSSFSLADYTQRKGAPCWCVLSSFVVGLFSCSDSCNVIEELRGRCFGSFEFVRLILPANIGCIGRLACFHFDFLRHYVDITYNSSAFLK